MTNSARIDDRRTFSVRGAQFADGTTGDLHVVDGVFATSAADDAPVIEADGLLALPGLVDLHTHLRQPGREDAETVVSGTAAAAAGGFTCVFAMANTTPVTDTAERAEYILDLGTPEAGSSAQVVPVGAVTRDLAGSELAELGLMARSRAKTRVFSDDGHCVSDPLVMRRALEWVRPLGGVIAQHSQDPQLAGPGACCHEGETSGRLGLGGWPWAAESTIVARDAQLAELTGSRLHVCHVSTAETVEVLRWAKARGIAVSAEVTPHHLLLDVSELTGYDTTFKVNPPLADPEDVAAVRGALADGTIDIVATDHAPHAPHDKDHAFVDARPGMLGLEQALAVVMDTMVATDAMTWSQVVQAMSTRPAQIGQVAGQGMDLSPGNPANLVLIDPTRRAVVDRTKTASLSRNNPYQGRDLPDPIEATFWAGRQTYSR